MSESVYRTLLIGSIVAFTVFFASVVVPPLIENPDIWGAFAAGFVNPYSSGYSTDVLVCWFVLAVWVIRDAKAYAVQYGWLCLLLGIVPGVAVGFALYLLIRHKQVSVIRRGV